MKIQLEKYAVYISEKFNSHAELNNFIGDQNYSSIFVIADENTGKYCFPLLKSTLPDHRLLLIRSGEKEKNIDTCKYLWDQLAENKAERKSLIINLGGGVIGDMGGFVASTYKRGIDFLNIPTTLLSQVDASVGGKLGIDHNGIKNLIGIFQDPKMVLIATEFLTTLPFEQLKSGFAEILKHALIIDKDYWREVKNISIEGHSDWGNLIERSVNIKKNVVEKDPLESGLRKILNFGHTIGHAIETWSMHNDKDPLLHGEAIAIGMICEAWLSKESNNLPEEELNDIVNTIFRYFEKYDIEKVPVNSLIELMLLDKKNTDGNIQFSLLRSIGECDFNKQVSDQLIIRSINFYSGL